MTREEEIGRLKGLLNQAQRELEYIALPVTNENNEYADCDQFICSNCGIELQDWVRVEREDGEVTHYEYEFKYCPNCGRKIIE